MPRKPMPRLVDRRCAHCFAPFKARASDVARGWGLFCSKACKANFKAVPTPETNPETPDV